VQRYRADLHIHTLLSPCASIEMNPMAIIKSALEKKIKIIGITDHNSTYQCATVKKIAEDFGIFVMCGVEITSKEQIHLLAFFEDNDKLNQIQEYIEKKIVKVRNNSDKNGYQAIVDENNNIIKEIDYYLGSYLDADINEVEEAVHKLSGIFIPAHIDRGKYSLMSQLGYVPDDIKADAMEIFNRTSLNRFMKENSYLVHYNFIRNSDSHYLDSIGEYYTDFFIEKVNFKEIRLALKNVDGRMTLIE